MLTLVKIRRRLKEENAANILHQLLTGIAYCHSKGIAHRDIKAENILLAHSGQVKIIDFGFSRNGLFANKDQDVIKSKTFCGSYAYACPKILNGIPYDPRLADVWSLGIVLYIMVSIRNFLK